MRYKAYINKMDISTWTPGNKAEDIDINSLIDEDDDLHVLQHRVRERGIENVKRTRIIDTLYEEKFNKRQEEVQNNLSTVVREQLHSILQKYVNKQINEETINNIKKDVALVLSSTLGTKMDVSELYIKEVNSVLTLSLPAYNIYDVRFTL